MATLYEYTITIKGRFPAENHAAMVATVRDGISMKFALHESIDELVIDGRPLNEDFEDMRRRFSDR